jgi:hypothetical protein
VLAKLGSGDDSSVSHVYTYLHGLAILHLRIRVSSLPSPRNGSPHLRSQHTITVHPGHAWQPVWQGLPPVVWFASLSPVALVGCALRLCIDISNVFGNILYLGMTCGFGLRSRLALALGLWPHTTPTPQTRDHRRERELVKTQISEIKHRCCDWQSLNGATGTFLIILTS